MPSERTIRPSCCGRRGRGPLRDLIARREGGEHGAAVVDFVLVGILVIGVSVALLQLALGLHVRNVLTDAAGEGARRAALVGGTTAEADARVRALADASLADGYVEAVTVTRTAVGGLSIVQVDVTAPLPVLGLLGPGGMLHVTGHAVDEAALVDVDGGEP
ncbi:TadE/TadG family type IV pilus assembly protein [Actinomyces procaprae]|uniref:TadE/TadG family type IV pilus assembly protein n=1 Tax=Actinomyces procaprae TaxID=2560010 RepID=UPI001EFF6726|nr:TadE/TadG family type IV pilus assembly protein [Actinomyces procaprae]